MKGDRGLLFGPCRAPKVPVAAEHAAWRNAGYPALMVTDTAHCHCPRHCTRPDIPDKVDFDRLARVFQGFEGEVLDLAH